jgi:hypothetical protein
VATESKDPYFRKIFGIAVRNSPARNDPLGIIRWMRGFCRR